MPTKRPDQLPSGQNFSPDDIIIVESKPDSAARKLLKSTVRDFMNSANEFDPSRVGQNNVIGFQSKFEWMVAQMQAIENSSYAENLNITPYEEFESAAKALEQSAITPSATPSITPTITPSLTPFFTPSATPSPTPTPSQREVQVTLAGPTISRFDLTPDLLPQTRGYTNWELKAGQDTSNVALAGFFGLFPDSFTPSAMGEKLFTLNKLEGTNAVHIDTATITANPNSPFFPITTLHGGLLASASIKFTIKYS